MLFLILRPILLVEFRGERPKGVVFLLDNSQSMQQRDRRLTDGDKARVAITMGKLPLNTPITDKMPLFAEVPSDPPRTEMVKNVLEHPDLKLLTSLKKHGAVHLQLFGGDFHELCDKKKDPLDKLLDSFTATDQRTALADSIIKILEAKDSDLPSPSSSSPMGRTTRANIRYSKLRKSAAGGRSPPYIWRRHVGRGPVATEGHRLAGHAVRR